VLQEVHLRKEHRVGLGKEMGILEGLIGTFWNTADGNLVVFSKIELRRAYQIPNVLDEDHIDPIQLELFMALSTRWASR
jgi:hypothetical protein